MKTFIYSVQESQEGKLVTASVFRVMKNTPVYLGFVTWNRFSYSGEGLEVRDWLIVNGHLSKKCKETYLYNNKKFNIFKIN
tara:strand:- start:190 stop:432 length:243 start_codon:yes stop_codon:yes gene_type:complete